jgi:hypothetical protein
MQLSPDISSGVLARAGRLIASTTNYKDLNSIAAWCEHPNGELQFSERFGEDPVSVRWTSQSARADPCELRSKCARSWCGGLGAATQYGS